MTTETKPEKEIKIPVKQRSASFAPPLKYKTAYDKEIEFTKKAAFDFLELKTFEGERAVRERHVQFLFDEWSAGRFLWPNIILASARLGDTEFRINGQHTCWMRVNVPERNEPLKVEIRKMIYTVATEEQLRTLYSVFDRGAPRTIGHISRVLLGGGSASRGVPPSLINQLIAGFKLHFSIKSHASRAMSPNEWCGLIENNHAELFGIVGHYLRSHCDTAVWSKRAAVVGAMFSTFEKNVQGSDEFWKPVFDGINLTAKTDARWQLRHYLETHGSRTVGGNIYAEAEEMYCVCLTQWNHWRAGEPVSNVKSVTARPKVRS